MFQLPNKEVIREALPVHWPRWKNDNKQQEFVRKHILPENMRLLFWKELQNWKAQGSVDIMYFKLRQTLNTTIYEMRFARTNSQFRLQCGYKPGRECEDIEVGREVCRYVWRTPRIIIALNR